MSEKKEQAVAVVEPAPVAPAALDTQSLIETALERGADVDVMEKLVGLAERLKANQAKEAWYLAMSKFQAKCPVIKKTGRAQIATKKGKGYGYSYAPLEAITAAILPIMGPLGLSVSWRNQMTPTAAVASCRISHSAGHYEESGEIHVPIVDEGAGANAAQRIGIANTYAKRYALLSIAGISPEDDPDAKGLSNATVAQPRRASKPADPPEGAEDDPNPVTAMIAEVVKARSGTSGSGQWTLWVVKTDGEDYGTFDGDVAEKAEGYAGTGEPVSLYWEWAKSGKKNVVDVSIAPDGE